jgi:hypothetical protein
VNYCEFCRIPKQTFSIVCENLIGIRYKEVDPKEIIFHNNGRFEIIPMEEYGEIIEKIDFKSITHNFFLTIFFDSTNRFISN